jgi:hypothetical protein
MGDMTRVMHIAFYFKVLEFIMFPVIDMALSFFTFMVQGGVPGTIWRTAGPAWRGRWMHR